MTSRILGLVREQVLAALAMDDGHIVEMQTGEGKTLAAVMPASLNSLAGRGMHVLTFNDYLARRDAEWMGPVYRFLGLSVACVEQGTSFGARHEAYRADITYVTAKEAGFDILVKRPDGAKRGSPMVVHTMFLYADGRSKHLQYVQPPYGLSFSTRPELLKVMPKPERSWVIGKGAVPLTTKVVDHDRWVIDGLHVSADYDAELKVTSILASLTE